MPSTIAIVGAGRVGRALGWRLREMGWTIGAVVTRSIPTARRAVKAIGGGREHAGLTRQVLAAHMVLITMPDGEIAPVAARLAKMGGEEWRGKVVLHTSGALDSSVIEPLARQGAATGSMHPMQTFSERAVPQLEGCVFALEGNPAALRVARRIVRGVGGIAVSVARGHKAAYHAAGALASGHTLAVVEAATRVLMSIGFSRRQAVRALLPLLRQTLANLERFGPAAAWTGPLSRGDFATVRRHAAALERFPKEYAEAYAALARLTALLFAEGETQAREKLDKALAAFGK